ncbi:unnamed protein product, partial [marine sediment metagenome]
DTYVVSWGFIEGANIIVDGMVGYRPTITANQVTGKVITIPVQSDNVTSFILALAERLSHRGTLLEVVFDQWNSQSSITRLRNEGIVAVETFFTNKYKNEMYTNFLEKLNQGAVRVFGKEPLNRPAGCPEYKPGWIEQMKLELK